ncbi:carbohydrate ABC transporter permease [Plantactinospora soyae]|uniref:Multiple sugar transport system permease protein n=1 Tax=Plantactinospora soyae TaxID=1544732 RepID=A0A927MAM9_9ACTN|nr:sugar ABC transporter permease [Plantactinospora soyae]MBE1491253.1 multiple sugar transport system permease protein [Plantactinospora soyae]
MATPTNTASRVSGLSGATPARRLGPGGRRRQGLRRRKTITPYLFLIAPVALLVVFTYVPVVNMFGYSVTSWNGLSPSKEFIGADNYIEIATRPELFGVLRVSLYYIGASVIQIVLALYFATVLSFNVRFRNFFKGIIFFPYLINGVAIAMVFLYFFEPGGTLDSTLNAIGLGDLSRQWLGDPGTINYSLAGTSLWRYLGLNFVLFLGAIQSIPAQLYEAAEIDGANRWHQFRFLILPGIRPIVGLSCILAISGSLSVFEIPYIMTGGANGSETFVTQTVFMAFKAYKVGLASAMAVVLLLIILLITWVQRRVVPDEKVNLS